MRWWGNVFLAQTSTLLSSRTSLLISLCFSYSVELASWERTVLFCPYFNKMLPQKCFPWSALKPLWGAWSYSEKWVKDYAFKICIKTVFFMYFHIFRPVSITVKKVRNLLKVLNISNLLAKNSYSLFLKKS